MINTQYTIYQVAQIRELEKQAQRFAITEGALMLRAGEAALLCLQREWPHIKKIGIICGNGNNGGDGYVLAQLAKNKGFDVRVWYLAPLNITKSSAYEAYEMCKKSEISISAAENNVDFAEVELIVDALYGIGFHGPMDQSTANIINLINKAEVPILSIDAPSGLNAETGEVAEACINATVTLTYIGFKLGLLTGPGKNHVGRLHLNTLRLPSELFELVPPVAELLRPEQFTSYLKSRPNNFHKGNAGHVLIIGGDLGMSGAPRMAGEAALRVGAGLVTLAVHPENAPFINLARPELMCHGINKTADLKPLVAKADVVVIGPGLGQSAWAKKILKYVLETEVPLVVDADALNLLATEKPLQKNNWILTPHPGEAARLLNQSVSDIQKNRLAALQQLQKIFGGIVVLKGAGTLIADAVSISLCSNGNPGMATAGMGDVLSGVIGGLVAQQIPLIDAAKLGVYLHANAGDLAAKEGERGMLALDLMPYLRHGMNAVGLT